MADIMRRHLRRVNEWYFMGRDDRNTKKSYYAICMIVLAAVAVLAVIYTMLHA